MIDRPVNNTLRIPVRGEKEEKDRLHRASHEIGIGGEADGEAAKRLLLN